MKNAERNLGDSVSYAKTAKICIEQSEVVVITTPWDEFKRLRPEDFAFQNKSRVLIDCWRLLGEMRGTTTKYIPIGVGLDKSILEKVPR